MSDVREQENEKARERSSAYRIMSEQWAWKDFMTLIDEKMEKVIKELKSRDDLDLYHAGRLSGKAAALEDLKKELDYIFSFKEGM